MAINITYPAPSNMAKVKKFGFYAPKTADTDQVNGLHRSTPYTTNANIEAGSSITIDSFTINNKITCGMYVKFGPADTTYGSYLQVYIDGSLVAEKQLSANAGSSLTDTIIVIGNTISPGTHTVEIKITNKGTTTDSLYVSDSTVVESIVGLIIKETTETTIASISLPDYTLIDEGSGSFKYEVGVYVRADAIRRTTSNAYMNSDRLYLKTYSNDYSSTLGYNVIPSGSDTEVVHIHISFKYPSDGNLNLTGWVGADGDVIIITNLYYQVCLLGNQQAIHYGGRAFISVAKGVHYIKSRHISLCGLYRALRIGTDNENTETLIGVASSNSGTDIIYSTVLTNMSELTFHADYGEFYNIEACIILFEVVVIE